MYCYTLLELNGLLTALPWQMSFNFVVSKNVLLVYIKGKDSTSPIVILKFIHA